MLVSSHGGSVIKVGRYSFHGHFTQMKHINFTDSFCQQHLGRENQVSLFADDCCHNKIKSSSTLLSWSKSVHRSNLKAESFQ